MEAVSVSISTELDDTEQRELLRLFSDDFIEAPEGQRLSPEWSTWLMIAKDAGAVFGAANAVIAFANHLIEWRKKILERGKRPAVHLTAEGGDLLDLGRASDDEIEHWLRRRSQQV